MGAFTPFTVRLVGPLAPAAAFAVRFVLDGPRISGDSDATVLAHGKAQFRHLLLRTELETSWRVGKARVDLPEHHGAAEFQPERFGLVAHCVATVPGGLVEAVN